MLNNVELRDRCKSSFLKERDRNLVVLVADRFLGRYSKIGAALSSVGKKVIFLCGEQLDQKPKWAWKSVTYKDVADCINTALQYNPVVYHVFCSWDFSLGYLFTQLKPGPVVIDDYDVLTGNIHDNHPDYSANQLQEFETLKAADGHCCRSLETQNIHRKIEPLKGVRGFFPDACWNKTISSILKNKNKDEFHIVYQGNVYTNFKNEKEAVNFHPWLIKHCEGQKIHYHLYPTNYPKDGSNDLPYRWLIEENRDNPYFHLHHTIPEDELVEELAQYDAGLLVMSKESNGLETANYKLNKYRYCMSNKIFDFFDAGLPVLIFPAWFLSSIACRYGGAQLIEQRDLLNLRSFLESIDLEDLRQGAINSRSVFDHKKNGPRLEKFYDKVVQVAYHLHDESVC